MRIIKLVDGKEFLITEKEFKSVLKASLNKSVFFLPRIGLMSNGNHVIVVPVEGQNEYGKPWRVALKKGDNIRVYRAFDKSGDGVLYAIGLRDHEDLRLGTKEEIEKENGMGSAVFEDSYYDLIRRELKSAWPNNELLDVNSDKKLLKI